MRLGAGCALTNDTAAENPLSNTIGSRPYPSMPHPIARGGLPSISAQGNDWLQNGLQGKHVEEVGCLSITLGLDAELLGPHTLGSDY
jgi:hypothetical protein